jgi:glutaminyl-tRNA synthetase
MPTIFGMRRRGYTPASIRAMADGTGASKTNIWLDYAVLEGCLRADLEGQAPRAMAVLDPLPAAAEQLGRSVRQPGHIEPCQAPAHPQHPELGQRQFGLGPRSGSSATTLPKCRPRASSASIHPGRSPTAASCPATRCA